MVLSFLGLVVAPTALTIWYFQTRPAWQLTVTNTDEGVRVVVTQEYMPEHVFTVNIAGASIDQPFEKLTRQEIHSADVRTIFFDDTLRPGRWKVVVAKTAIDFWPACIAVNEKVMGNPGDTLTVGETSEPE